MTPATPVTPLETRRVINGREGKLFLAGNIFLSWVQSVEARAVLDRADVVRSGALVTGYKLTGANGTGTINGFHVTSKFRQLVSDVMRTGVMHEPTYLTMELSDPEQFRQGLNGVAGDLAIERVVLKQVYFWETPLGFDVSDTVRDDIPFTFEELDWANTIAPPGINF